jgi:hypothetical protein
MSNRLRDLGAKAGEIASQAARLDPKTNNRDATLNLQAAFSKQVEVVTKFASKMATFDDIVTNSSDTIEELMEHHRSDADYAERLRSKQNTRTAVLEEKKYAEQKLMEHFDGGASRNCGGIKVTLKELDIPSNLSKSKGVEFIKALKYYFKGRAPWYYTIMPYVIRIMGEAKIGNHFVPPSKANGYAGCPMEFRERYAQHAQDLYDYLEIHVPKEVMANIRKTFKYGLEDCTGQCEIGDGPTAIFCILALYRPSGETYREEIKEKICGLATKFNDGANPTAKINESMATLQEAIDLDIKIPWNRSGKLIVTLLSERSNTFARSLTAFTEVGAIVDKDNAAIELKNMFATVVEACKTLQESGQEVKRIMAVDNKPAGKGGKGGKSGKGGKGGKAQTGDTGNQDTPCHFHENCTRFPCSFGHTKAENAKKNQAKGKGGQGGGKGQKTKFSGKCQANQCEAPGKGYRLCTKCHRSGLETGSPVKLKDGTEYKVELSAKSAQEKRIAQLEKKLAQHEDDGTDSEYEEPNSGGKRKRVTFAGGKGGGSIMDRLGLPSMRIGPNGTTLNSPESVNDQ